MIFTLVWLVLIGKSIDIIDCSAISSINTSLKLKDYAEPSRYFNKSLVLIFLKLTQSSIKFLMWVVHSFCFPLIYYTQHKDTFHEGCQEQMVGTLFTDSQGNSWTHCINTNINHENPILCLNAVNIHNHSYRILMSSLHF